MQCKFDHFHQNKDIVFCAVDFATAQNTITFESRGFNANVFSIKNAMPLFSSTPPAIPNLAHYRALLYCRCVRTWSWGGVLAW